MIFLRNTASQGVMIGVKNSDSYQSEQDFVSDSLPYALWFLRCDNRQLFFPTWTSRPNSLANIRWLLTALKPSFVKISTNVACGCAP